MTSSAAAFLPGLVLSRALYEEAVRPLLDDAFPGLRHTAARIGAGSEVLGFDTPRSADHEWGPRLELFLTPRDRARHGAAIRRMLAERLPKEVRGWPTHFEESGDPRDPVGRMSLSGGPVNHRVDVHDLDSWLTERLGLTQDAARRPDVRQWLALPQQRLAETTGGAVFHDGLGTLGAVREALAWYPDQVWRYVLACQWQRLAQEEAFVGRCAETGDDLGAAVVAARLLRELMRLCLLLERRYAPYAKWLGAAFARLPMAGTLTPVLRGVLGAADQPGREAALCTAYGMVAALHNATGLTPPLDPACRPYHGRPFAVLRADRFARALEETVTDPWLRALPPVGAVDQWADSTDLLRYPHAVHAASLAAGRALADDAGETGTSGDPPPHSR